MEEDRKVTNQAELERLQHMPNTSMKPAPGMRVRLVARCPGNAADVLRKCKEVLVLVLQQDVNNWPSIDEWRSLLPSWFVRQSEEEVSSEKAEQRLRLSLEERIELSKKWSVSAFVYWFQPNDRYWFWWDATAETASSVSVTVMVEDLPFPWGALEWLLRTAGAASVELLES